MKPLFENWRKFILEEGDTKSQKEYVLKIPKPGISNEWGKPNSYDRKIINMFFEKISPATDFKSRLTAINSFIGECGEDCQNAKDVSEILGNLMFIETLASIIENFDDQAGGWLFESLVASLFGGEKVDVGTKLDPGSKGEDIADAIIDGKRVSIKFISKNYVRGSYDNLMATIQKERAPITYFVAIKNREHKGGEVLSIDFYEFTVGSRELGIEGEYDASEWDNRRQTACGTKGGFKIKCLVDKEINPKAKGPMATLNFGSKTVLKEVTEKYHNRLGSLLFEIYEQIESLSNNVNNYYLNSDAKAAEKAIGNAEKLKTDIRTSLGGGSRQNEIPF